MWSWRKRSDDDFAEEIRANLALETDRLIAAGMKPEDARSAARRTFGNVTRAQERFYESGRVMWLDDLQRDMRYACRTLVRNPGFTTIAVLTLALGIGLTTAVFTVISAVLLRPLAFVHPSRMVWVATLDDRGQDEFVGSEDLLAWQDATSLERLVAYDVFDGRVTVDGITEPARIATVSDDFWPATGARTELGRLPADGRPEALVSWATFQQRFNADPSIVGKPAVVNGRPSVIVGVLPKGFRVDLVQRTWAGAVPRDADVYQAIRVLPLPSGAIRLFSVVAQTRRGVSIETAKAELAALRARVAQAKPDAPFRPTLRVAPLEERLLGRARRDLSLLFGTVVLMLLTGCANVAGLLVTRAIVRQKEVAIRTAIGAGRAAILRPAIVEGLLLAALAGSLGLVLAQQAVLVTVQLIPGALPRLIDAAVDTRAVVFALLVSALTALIFSVGPRIALWKTNVYDVLKDGTRTTSGAVHGVRLRTALVTSQIMVTVVLLCGAGLLARSLWVLKTYPADFDPERTVTATVNYNTGGRQAAESQRREYVAETLRRLAQLPPITVVGMTTNASGRLLIVIEGAPPMSARNRRAALLSSVSEDYARAIGMRVVEGRWITDSDPAPTCVINEQLAARDFPGEDPIGQRLQIAGPPGATGPDVTFATIVGVVADLRYGDLETPPEPEIFAGYRHMSPFGMTFVARLSGHPRSAGRDIREVIASVDRFQSVSEVKTLANVLDDSMAPRRFNIFLFGIFSATALLFAMIGVYGALAYAAALQTREIGIRMAFGAQRGDVLWLTLRRASVIVSVGLLGGIAGAMGVTRLMVGLLYGVTPMDPLTFATVTIVVAGTSLAACALPAWRAANLNPAVALRAE